jgi:hypothetical protein
MTAEALEELLGRPWRGDRHDADIPWVKTMLSTEERRLLYGLAREYASGQGAIVDAGCFLGGSTVALLAGVRDRARRWEGPPIASYDLFRVDPPTISKYFDDSVSAGDSFRARFDANVAGFGVPHVVHEGDIAEIGWTGGPIEVLFLDVLKTWELNDAVVRDFFPSLVPGRSVVVHQDYGWGWQPWIPITVELIGDSLRLVDWMEYGSHVFFVQGDIPASALDGVSGLDLDAKLELMQRAVDRSEGWVRGMLEIGRASLLGERDGSDVGQQELARIAERYAEYPSVQLCLSYVRRDHESLRTLASNL